FLNFSSASVFLLSSINPLFVTANTLFNFLPVSSSSFNSSTSSSRLCMVSIFSRTLSSSNEILHLPDSPPSSSNSPKSSSNKWPCASRSTSRKAPI
ncbi:hypothetical protein BGX38DRAFT_1214184, partial [Terfezia claveryi]